MIKERYIELIKSSVDICQLALDICPGTVIDSRSRYKKCLCVFHQEKTPSLHFDLTLNRYKCFGCGKGGDVISFTREVKGLGFSDAVSYLASRYCPDIAISELEGETNPKNRELERHRESLYICNEHAYDFFRSQYESDSDEARACRTYAECSAEDGLNGRWEREFCRTIGLGYSPKEGNTFVKYAEEKGLDFKYLLELGLIAESERHPGTYYDFYRGRLMIPQRDNYGRILTFTARILDDRKEYKYLNGRDSLIYKKSESIFGIDVALRIARKTGKVFLLEGAPDVMRLQSLGIGNAVASLGGVWSEKQLSVFRHFGCRLCFIPDADVPKEGSLHGKGHEFVFQNGRRAMELGFLVTVREIPSSPTRKEDADSYLTSLSRWEGLKEKDFVLWYAEKHYEVVATHDEQLRVISDVCDLLVQVSSPMLQASILEELQRTYKRKTVWKTALSDALIRLQAQKRDKAIKGNEQLDGYRFFRKGRHYYDIDQRGKVREWTNFIINPLFFIADDANPTRILELENESGSKRLVELKQADVSKLERFKAQIEGKGDFRFFESQEKYEMLKAYMYGRAKEAQRVISMGWNQMGDSGFYAFCNGVVCSDGWKPVNEYGIVELESGYYYLPAMSRSHAGNPAAYVNERRFAHIPRGQVSLFDYFSLLLDLYGDNAVIALCYYMASLFRDVIVDSTRSFPLLNIYGKKGTGKTEFVYSLLCMTQKNPEICNFDNTSFYAMGDKCAEICNGLVHFDEYKNTLNSKYIDFLKGTYDGVGRVKKADEGDRRETTKVGSGVVLSGQEMPTVDIALFSRVIFLESQKSERTKEETDLFHELIRLRNLSPTNITVDIVRQREHFRMHWHSSWQRAQNEIKESIDYSVVGERFINNWAVMLATMYSLEACLELPFTSGQVRDICIKKLDYQYSLCNSSDEVARFWSMFSKSRQFGEIREGQDYKIQYVDMLKVNMRREPSKTLSFEESKPVLFVREKICIAKTNIQARREGKTQISDESLLSYLVSTPEYYGKTVSALKFHVFDETGNPMRTRKDGREVLCYEQERVLAFDYDSICSNYDIDLKVLLESSNIENG